MPIFAVTGAKFFGVAAKGCFWESLAAILKCQTGEERFLGGYGLFLEGIWHQFAWSKNLWEANKGILGVGFVAFLVRRAPFEAMSRFWIDFDGFWEVSGGPGKSKTMHFASYIL